MAKTKAQLRTENSNNFPNNNSQFITPEKLRGFNNDIIDSVALEANTQLSGTGSFSNLSGSGYVSASEFIGDGSKLTNISSTVPAGTVSGSSQVILTDTTGNLGGNRITGSVPNAISSSFATTASFALNVPTVDTGSLLETASVVDATITFTKADASTFNIEVNNVSSSIQAEDLVITVKNVSGVTLPAGTAVKATGVVGENITIVSASADNPSLMPAIGVLNEQLTSNSTGECYIAGRLENINTSNLVAGAAVYVNNNGGLTATKPTGSYLIQNIGIAAKINATEGEIIVEGAGRTNDLPNLTSGYIWLGNNNGVPAEFSTGSIAFTNKNNTFTGTQNFTNISVSGTGSFAYLQSVTGSAKIIGDAFIILNNDTPTERYAGIKIYDSGSANNTSSFQYDGSTDDWFFEKDVLGSTEYGIALFGPEYTTKGTPTYNTNNTIPKGTGGHHLNDSSITDNGTTVETTNTLNVQNNSGITIQNQSGTGQVRITPGPDFSTKFDSALIEGFDKVGANQLSGSTHQIGYASNDIRIKNLDSSGSPSIDLGFGTADGDYSVRISSGSNLSEFRGDIQTTGNISGSSFNGTGLLSGSIAGQLPSGVVSGSSQINYPDISNIPSGILSSSAQIKSFGDFATTGSNTFNGDQTITGSIFATSNAEVLGVTTTNLSTFSGQTDFSGSVNIGNSANFSVFPNSQFQVQGLPALANFAATELFVLPTTTNIGNRGYDLDSAAIKRYGNSTDISVANGVTYEYFRSGSQLASIAKFSPLQHQLFVNAGNGSEQAFVNLIDNGGGGANVSIAGSNISIGTDAIVSQQFALNNPSATIPVDVYGTQGLRVISNPGAPKPAVHLMPDGSVSASAAISSSGDLTINNINASGTFTASLTEGYVWAGGAGNVTQLVATSSFGGGGGGIFNPTGSFYSTTNDLQVTGSFGVQGAIGGTKETLTITSLTASIDLTTSNTYELTLVSSADTHLDVTTFGEDGQSINVLVKQPTSGNTGSISFSSDFKFGQGYSYVPTAANSSEDIVSFTRFGNFLYGTFINNFS